MTTPGAAQPNGRPEQQDAEAAAPAQRPTLGYAGAPPQVGGHPGAPQPARGYAGQPGAAGQGRGYGGTYGTPTTATYGTAAATAAAAAAATPASATVTTAAPPTQARRAQAQQPVSAATATASAPTPVAVRARPRRLRRTFGTFLVVQILCWQLAGAAVLAAYRAAPLAAAAVGAVLLPLLVPTVIRRRGRWLYQWAGLWLSFRTRRHQMALSGDSAALDLLTFAEETASLQTLDVDGRDIALLAHRGGLCAVFELGPDDTVLLVGEAVKLPSPATLLPAPDPQKPQVAAQLLVSLTPAPVVAAGLGLVARSYLELSGGEVPADRRAWLVLQAVRSPEAYADADLRPALAAAVRRARRQLRQDKVSARLLDRDELLAAVSHLARLSAPVTEAGPQPAPGRETWRAWWIGNAPQTSRRLVDWPAEPWELDALLLRMPAVGSVLSVAVARDPARAVGGENLTVEVAIRLAAHDPSALGQGDTALEAAIRSGGGRTERLDGEQIDGLVATLPFGGFLT